MAPAGQSNSVLAGIFILSLLSMILVPYTLCARSGSGDRSARRAHSHCCSYVLFGGRSEEKTVEEKPKATQWAKQAVTQARSGHWLGIAGRRDGA
jgi:hypothetical protein